MELYLSIYQFTNKKQINMNDQTKSNFDISKWKGTLKILFDDGVEYTLPDISYDKFVELDKYEGGSDIEYDKYLLENRMKDLSDFNSDSTDEITLIDEQPYRGRVLKFRLIYDSDKDMEFNETDYFGDID